MKELRTIVTKATDRYQNPFIPKGFSYLKGEWNAGFVIADDHGNTFALVPVGGLKKNGTLNGITFDSQFGMRNWNNNDFSLTGWHEDVPENIKASVEEWGGFYLACYYASLENERVVFKANKLPLIGLCQDEARELEASFSTNTEEVSHCLTLGSAYDTLCEWIIESFLEAETIVWLADIIL